jgi:Undecaprenyl-phosphate glucose phosphotransferase
MYIDQSHLITKQHRPWTGRHFSAEIFNAAMVLLQSFVVVVVAPATGYLYHFFAYGHVGIRQDFVLVGLIVAIFYALPQAYASYHRFWVPPHSNRDLRRVFACWNFAFFCMLIVAFMTEQSVEYSRGWILSLYVAGLAALLALELATLAIRKAAIASGLLLTRRLLVVGNSVDIAKFARTCSFDSQGIEIVAAAEIARNMYETWSYAEQDAPSVQAAIAAARKDNVSDIVILTNWKDARASAMIAETFLDVPAAVHLVGLDVFEQFSQLGVDHVGRAKTILIRRQPLSVLQAAVKRGFDISVASIALLLLAPFLILTAILIRLDTRGPAFFLQRRRGFNHKEFRIIKFRTMTTADDGDQIRQATNNDLRITRLGRILRKYNIDELPQLVNVLLGHMSLVGPRPHAVAHDGYYERIIRRYGRRLNMRPGITGWAQIHGHRGETATRAAMEARVEHDLHYIENWSVALDIYVLLMTIISRRAYRNAI